MKRIKQINVTAILSSLPIDDAYNQLMEKIQISLEECFQYQKASFSEKKDHLLKKLLCKKTKMSSKKQDVTAIQRDIKNRIECIEREKFLRLAKTSTTIYSLYKKIRTEKRESNSTAFRDGMATERIRCSH